MKLAFVFTGNLFKAKDGHYETGSFDGLYERYSYLSNDITLVMRERPLEEGMRLDRVPEDAHVVGYPNYMDPKLYFNNILAARRIVEDAVRDADAVILRGPHFGEEFARKHDKPYIVECIGCTWDALWNHGIEGKGIAIPSFLHAKRVYARAPYVQYVTSEFLQKRYPTKGKALACSDVVISIQSKGVLNARLGRARDLGNGRIVMGTAAAIDVTYKGQQDVIRAIPYLTEKGFDIEYRLAGANKSGSSYLADLAKRLGVSDRVAFLGPLPSTEMPSYYDSLDLYVQPSKTEGLPRAVVEAMSRGCPVIGSNVGGIPELIDSPFLFRAGSARAIARSVEQLLTSGIESACVRNFNKAKEFAPDTLRAKRERFYDDFLAHYKLTGATRAHSW